MKSDAIEPGLLSIFRLFARLMLFLLSLSLCSINKRPFPDYFYWFTLLYTAFLAVYLSWGWVQRRLRALYLPIALLVASLVPIFADAATNVLYLQTGLVDVPDFGDSARLYFWLILPLLLVSTQYGLRIMLLYTTATSALPVVLAIMTGMNETVIGSHVTNGVIRFLLYTVVGFVVVYLSNAQRTQRIELAQKNEQLAHYATTLEQLTIVRERNRLARELHDTLAHTLSAVNVQLKALEVLSQNDPSAAQKLLKETQEMTRTGLQESRRALRALRASPIEELGLVLALQHLATQAAERASLQLSMTMPQYVSGLRPEVEQNLYRTAEEALNNIVRHANARSVKLCLEHQHKILRLTISDDGLGFDPNGVKSGDHFGLTGMRERAMLVNGTLNIISQPQQGTTIQFEVAAS